MAGLIAFFTALPAFIELLSQLGLIMQRLITLADKNNLNDWILQLEKTVDGLEKAKTSEDKFKAAQDLVGLVRTVKST